MNSWPVVYVCVCVYAPHVHVCLNLHICVRLGAWRMALVVAQWNRLEVIQLRGRSSSVSPNRSSLHFHSTAAVFTSSLAQNASAHTHAHTNTPASCHTSRLRNHSLIKKRGFYVLAVSYVSSAYITIPVNVLVSLSSDIVSGACLLPQWEGDGTVIIINDFFFQVLSFFLIKI